MHADAAGQKRTADTARLRPRGALTRLRLRISGCPVLAV